MRMLLFALAALALAPIAEAESLADLDWLKGCWRAEVLGEEIIEVWTTPPAPVMLGVSVTRRDGRTVSWRQMRIEELDGGLAFVPMTSGAASGRYAMSRMDDEHVAFESPEQDYPQRISYGRLGRMLTRTTDNRLAHVPGEAFAYQRISCPREFLP